MDQPDVSCELLSEPAVTGVFAKGTGQLSRLRASAELVNLVIRTGYFPMHGILKPLDHRLEMSHTPLERLDSLDWWGRLGARPPACDAEEAVKHRGSGHVRHTPGRLPGCGAGPGRAGLGVPGAARDAPPVPRCHRPRTLR